MTKLSDKNYIISLLFLYLLVLIWSAIAPKLYIIWLLEVLPAIIGIGFCIYYYKIIKFTRTTYTWCFVAVILMTIGAHYTYSEVPLFDTIKEVFHLSRNNYDKLGHFVQGVVPVLICREILIQKNILLNTKWVNFLSFCLSVSISAFYEIVEWSTILVKPETITSFLGMQGNIWDTQSDILFAMLGASYAIIFSKQHYKSIQAQKSKSN